jgi:twitching motility protein PilT
MPRTLHDLTGVIGRPREDYAEKEEAAPAPPTVTEPQMEAPALEAPAPVPPVPAPVSEVAAPEAPVTLPSGMAVQSGLYAPAPPDLVPPVPAPVSVVSAPEAPVTPPPDTGLLNGGESAAAPVLEPSPAIIRNELSFPSTPTPPPSIPVPEDHDEVSAVEISERSRIDKLLEHMVQKEASDLHLKVGSPPGIRVSGRLTPIRDTEPLTPEDTWGLIELILSPEQMAQFQEEGDCDLAYSAAGLGRFRVNVMMQRGSAGMVLRRIPHEIPSLEDLSLPSVCENLVMKPRGLVLITGPTGSGKSTTRASMIDHRNRREAGHIVTLEDPIEFVHSDRMSYISQREVGADTKSFTGGLRRALRQDPDVILIGELRDLETISMALTAAETGHLVLATLHTTGAVQTVDRIVDVFPSGQQQQVRLQLSGALQGVISQVLVPKIGGGRVAALEILVAVDAVRACIREGKTPQLVNSLQTGGRLGMTLLDASLARLVKRRQIELTEAMAKANKPDDLKVLLGK